MMNELINNLYLCLLFVGSFLDLYIYLVYYSLFETKFPMTNFAYITCRAQGARIFSWKFTFI